MAAAGAVRDAVENPVRFVPLSQAVIPDDHVALAVDPSLPQLGGLLSGLWGVLASAGVKAENVTLISPPGASEDW